MDKKPVSLVLSSGGARGMAHIGVIEELERFNFEIKAISGCSIGALIGGIYAAGHLQEYKKWLSELEKLDVFKLMDFSISSHGFIKGLKVFNEINKFIGDVLIEDLPIPFTAVATDVNNQKEVIFSKGKLRDAIRASVSIPSVLEPFYLEETILVDGGVLNPLPLDLVNRTKNDLLVAIDLNSMAPSKKMVKPKKSKIQKRKEQNSILKRIEFKEQWERFFPKDKSDKEKLGHLSILDRTYDMMQNKISRHAIQEYQPDILVSISRTACSTFDFYRADEMIELGKQTFNEELRKYDQKMIEKYKNM
ncbi:MAG: phospholipase [Bacteroidetes bacterium]|nr:MAG: phospholipase [Bacteroidota bacterium]